MPLQDQALAPVLPDPGGGRAGLVDLRDALTDTDWHIPGGRGDFVEELRQHPGSSLRYVVDLNRPSDDGVAVHSTSACTGVSRSQASFGRWARSLAALPRPAARSVEEQVGAGG